ncbi:24710_t:CDS:2, partial [Gigaspora rosea]
LFLEKYNLSAESNLSQLHDYASELGAMLPNWKAAKAAQYCAKTGDVWDIYLHALDLAMPKNNTDEAIVASSSRISQFCRELTEAGVGSEQIDIYAKLPEVTRASNEIPKRQLEQRLPYPPKTLKHFSLEEELRIIQNINTTKIPTIQDLADYKPGYSWYCIGYIKNKGEAKNNPKPRQFLSMEKNLEHAKELLIWIQDAIATRKLRDPVYSISGKCNTGVFSKFLKPYSITAKRLRKIGGKHASRVHDWFDSGKYYAKGDTSDSDLDSDPELDPKTLAPTPKPINENTSEIKDIYDLYGIRPCHGDIQPWSLLPTCCRRRDQSRESLRILQEIFREGIDRGRVHDGLLLSRWYRGRQECAGRSDVLSDGQNSRCGRPVRHRPMFQVRHYNGCCQ